MTSFAKEISGVVLFVIMNTSYISHVSEALSVKLKYILHVTNFTHGLVYPDQSE